MLPASPTFLFMFLPVVLVCSWLLPTVGTRNAFLLVASVAFYGWGQGAWTLVLALCVASTYLLGTWLEGGDRRRPGPWASGLAVVIVLAPLAVTKYTGFFLDAFNNAMRHVGGPTADVASWSAPAGISFFTFMALTYVVGVSRGEVVAQRRVLPLALYMSFFPLVLAGPIMRYGDALPQLMSRRIDLAAVGAGARRFTRGLAKKVLIADTLASPATLIFGLPHYDLTPAVAWFGLGCYTLQIFLDFSAYSDMAIGTAGMMGFRVPENFDYPYSARSVRAFWTKWHITLSFWFRDYVFLRVLFPAGRFFERAGLRAAWSDFWAYAAAALVTMLLIGLWHGAAWTFVAWGCYHGSLLVMERTRAGRWIARLPKPAQHGYLLFVTMGGWVVFRSTSLKHAGRFLAAMSGLAGGEGAAVWRYAGGDVLLAAAAGVLLSSSLMAAAAGRVGVWLQRATSAVPSVPIVAGAAFETTLLVLTLSWLSGGTFMPFIYFQF